MAFSFELGWGYFCWARTGHNKTQWPEEVKNYLEWMVELYEKYLSVTCTATKGTSSVTTANCLNRLPLFAKAHYYVILWLWHMADLAR